MIISKPSSAQEFEWANHFAGQGISNPFNLNEGASHCYALTVDENDFVYVSGICNDSVDFDPGPTNDWEVAGQNDIYIAKFSPSGVLVWKRVLFSNSKNYVKSMTLDPSGNIVLTGSIETSVDFDPDNAGGEAVTSSGNSMSMYIAKYTSDGDFLWVKNAGAPFAVWSNDIDIDAAGNIYATGNFYDSLDIDPSPGVYPLLSNGQAIFFSKYSPSGDLIWAKHIPNCINLSEAADLDLSEDGDIFISGFFGNTVDFDPGPATFSMTSETTSDRYFAKYTSDGDFIWARHINVNDDIVLSHGRSVELAVDENENVILTGDFKLGADFDPGPNQFNMTATNSHGTYLCKYDENGDFVWGKAITEGYCVANDIGLDCYGNINITGVFLGADFDPGPDVYFMQISTWGFTNFFAEYDSDGNFRWAREVGKNGSGIIKSGIHVKEDHQYLYGAFKSTGDFNPDENEEYLLTSSGIGWNSWFGKYHGEWTDSNHDIVACDDEVASLQPEVLTDNLLWSDGSNDTVLFVAEAGTYWSIQTEGGCSRTDTFFVNIEECGLSNLKMPNVFSPNADNTNDVFLPIETYNITQYELIVLNRWGQRVFETRSQLIGWDGTSRGRECVEGIYFWVVNYYDHNYTPQTQTGHVQLVR